ncbi:hypothetical protein UPYG_G00107650 [Umbra pygmaea]|uniref:CARD domain-containing protein n=1 Tax=Umbra pygmaea TaxID=75934 RepID=A0ABD0X6F4_UMBPY
MIQVEANMTNDLYIAEIEFITVKDWEEELSSIFISRSFEEGRDEDKEGDDDDDDENDDEEDEKITALYGKDGRGKNIKELMEKKHFKEIPEFYSSRKKLFFCHTDEELSEKITSFTRSDTQSATCTFKQHYWPLVKCITIKVPNCNELLEHVVLVDLPGNGDCNKGRDEMWKSFVGNCSAVWIVSDISRATSEKESWEILDSTARLLGPGGECRRIGFICTKTDDIGDNQNVDAHTWILNRNKATKIKVTEKFNKNKEVKKHFSGEKNFFQVFTVSSKEYKKRKHLEKSETEIPHLQEFLRNLNDHRTRTSDYISGACGILSLIQGAKSSDMTDSKEKVWRVLEKRLQDKLKSIEESIEEPYQVFDRCLLQGVQQSEESCEKLINKVIEPKGKKGGGFHKVLKSLCKNYGVYKQKGKKNRRKEINLNETLVSCMRSCIDEEFKNFFPNDKCGPIREQVENFTLDTKSLVVAHPSVSLHLEFLKTEERELKAKLVCDLREKKKKIYFTLTESVMDSMHSCYRRASAHTGKDTLKRMKDEIRHHVKTENIFQKAKDDMLKSLTNLKDHILNELKRKLQESIEISLKKPNSSFLPDVTKEYNNIQKLKVCSIILPLPPILDLHPNPTGFQFQLLEENRNVQTQQMQLQAQQPCLSIPIPMYQPYFQPKEETLVKIVGPADLNSSNMQLKPTSLDKGSNDHRDLACLVPTGPTDAASGSGALSVHPHTPEPALLPTEDGGPKTILNQLSDAAFVDKHRGAIIQRVKMVEKIADDLFLDDMIKDETYAKISEVSTTQEKMTTLLEAVHAGGTIVTSAFFKALQIYESPLVQDLGNVLTKEIA